MTSPPIEALMVKPKFAVGQVWRDGSYTKRAQTIVAVTDHERLPIITQDPDGSVWSYGADGKWVAGFDDRYRRYDLTTLISDPHGPAVNGAEMVPTSALDDESKPLAVRA